MAIRTITLSHTNWTASVSTIYFDDVSNVFSSDAAGLNPITAITPPVRECWRFFGYQDGNGIMCIDRTGAILPSFRPSANVTITQSSQQISWKLTLSANGGVAGEITALYQSLADGRFWLNDTCDDVSWTHNISRDGDTPTRANYQFAGFVNATNGTGALYIDYDGSFTEDMDGLVLTANKTIYAKWITPYKLTINKNSGTGGTDAFWFNQIEAAAVGSPSGCFYPTADASWREFISDIIPPTRSQYEFLGIYSGNNTTSTQVVDEWGRINLDWAPTAAATIYAQWRIFSRKVTLNHDGGAISPVQGGGALPAFIYLCNISDEPQFRYFAEDDLGSDSVWTIGFPYRPGYECKGYYTAQTGGVQVLDGYGYPVDEALESLSTSADFTLYAQWERTGYVISLNPNGGSAVEDETTIVWDLATERWLANDYVISWLDDAWQSARPGYVFAGFFSAASGGTQYVNHDGTFIQDMPAPAADAVWYAHWSPIYKITVDAASGSGGLSEFYYNSLDFAWLDAPDVDAGPVSSVDLPVRPGYTCDGLYLDNTQVVDASGQISLSWQPNANTRIQARWSRVYWLFTFDPNGAPGNPLVIYFNIANGTFHLDDTPSSPAISSVSVPDHPTSDCLGFYEKKTGTNMGSRFADGEGNILAASLTADTVCYARWIPAVRTLTLDPGEGTCSVESLSVTCGVAIGTLPVPVSTTGEFSGWYINSSPIDERTVWMSKSNQTAVARYLPTGGGFSRVADFFGLASDALVPIASESGDNRKHICVSHNGRFTPSVFANSHVWRNPTVTYQIVKDCTVEVVLGRAFAAKFSGSEMIRSGYMIVSAKILTAAGTFPQLVIEAVANEGADAINLFPVSVPVVARSKAQNILGALNGAGHLQKCELVAACDPVVIDENLMPCASDVVNGRLDISADILTLEGASVPDVSAAGFVLVGDPQARVDCAYVAWNLHARKELA